MLIADLQHGLEQTVKWRRMWMMPVEPKR
jgi:hypothetical protein